MGATVAQVGEGVDSRILCVDRGAGAVRVSQLVQEKEGSPAGGKGNQQEAEGAGGGWA